MTKTSGYQSSGSGLTQRQRVATANRWREQYNPLRGLTMARAVSLIESYTRGETTDLMWTFGAPGMGIECSDADYLALIERCLAPLLEMDWNVKVTDEGAPGAGDQRAYVEDLVNGICNFSQALEHLALARFRAFSHLEIIDNLDGDVVELRPVDQWNVVRDGMSGAWKYNPQAAMTSFTGLPDEFILDPSHFIIREVSRPLWRIALTSFIRKNLSQKDWDAFIEIYGVPGGIVTLPPDVPQDKEAAYLATAEKASEGGHAALPNGSTYTPNDQPRGENPFRDHLKYQQEQLILAGTGGKLTMLAESGSGTLAGGAHSDTFKSIASAEAAKISEVIQRQLLVPRIRERFPGQVVVAYFDLAANEETNTGEFVKDVQTLSASGFQVSAAQVTEKTGYEVSVKPDTEPAAPINPGFRNRKITNAVAQAAKDQEVFLRSAAEKLGGHPDIAALLEEALTADDDNFQTEIEGLKAKIPALLEGNPEAIQVWEEVLGTALVSGLSEKSAEGGK